MFKILLSSYSFAPEHGSESELGWRFVESLKEECEIVVFVWSAYKEFFDDCLLKKLSDEGVEVEFVGFNGVLGKVLATSAFERVSYILWQRRLPRWVREKYDPSEFDLVHHVSWASFSTPTSLWRLNRPLVIGPVGGGETVSPGLLSGLPLLSKVYERIRGWRILLKCWDRELGRSLGAANLVWAANPETAQRCQVISKRDNIEVRTQVSISNDLPAKGSKPKRFVVMTVARLVPLKRTDLILRAFLEAEGLEGELRIVGDGPELEKLKALAEKGARAARKVTFCGWMSREEVANELKQASVFAFSSLHDSASFAVLEALSHGLPVVVLGSGGPSYLIRDGAGLVVSAETCGEAVKGFSDCFERLYHEPELVADLSEKARSRALSLTRHVAKETVLKAYDEIMRKERQVVDLNSGSQKEERV